MKQDLQPEFYQATVTCNCGNTFTVGSTKKEGPRQSFSTTKSQFQGTTAPALDSFPFVKQTQTYETKVIGTELEPPE